MKIIKSIIKNFLRKKGFVINPYNEYKENLEKVKYNWLLSQNINTIIDVGVALPINRTV